MDEKLKWIEEEAKVVSAFQVSCADALERQASALLNLLLMGAGGALAYAVNLAEKKAPLWLQTGMAASSAWLFAVAALLLFRALWSRPFYASSSEPGNLLPFVEHTMEELRRAEMKNRQFAIAENRARNSAVGNWLDICRGLATFTPVAFAIAAWAAGG